MLRKKAENHYIRVVYCICSVQLLAHLQNIVKKSKLADLCYTSSSSPATYKNNCDCTHPCIVPVLINTSDDLPTVIVLKAKNVSLKVRKT